MRQDMGCLYPVSLIIIRYFFRYYYSLERANTYGCDNFFTKLCDRNFPRKCLCAYCNWVYDGVWHIKAY